MAEEVNAKRWAEITFRLWQVRQTQLKITNTGALLNSFRYFAHYQANGMLSGLKIDFLMYGRYVDMGVGRGIFRGNSGDLGFTPKRQPRLWYPKIKYRESLRLLELLAAQYGKKATDGIVAEFKKYNT